MDSQTSVDTTPEPECPGLSEAGATRDFAIHGFALRFLWTVMPAASASASGIMPDLYLPAIPCSIAVPS